VDGDGLGTGRTFHDRIDKLWQQSLDDRITGHGET